MKKYLFLNLLFLSLPFYLFSSFYQAGEIIVRQLEDNPLVVEASVVIYTKTSSVSFDFGDAVEICWGDGSCEMVTRVNGIINNDGIGSGEFIPCSDTKLNIYTKQHTYLNTGNFTVTMTRPGRCFGILNLNFPTSEQVPLILATEFNLFNPLFENPPVTSVFLQEPIDLGYVGQKFIHTPNVFSLEDDSIAYELITPIGAINYVPITDIMPGPENNLEFNEETGLLVWDAPQLAGFYSIMYLVKIYRGGQEISRMVRDIQIEIKESTESIPSISLENIIGNEEVILVEVGDTVRLNVSAEFAADNAKLSATCGLFDFYDNPATFTSNVIGTTATGVFEWIVEEEHIRTQPYQLVAKATLDGGGLAKIDMAVVRYQVISLPTSIQDITHLPSFNIFPNPVHNGGVLHLDIDNRQLGRGYYKIINPLGQVIRERYNNYNEIEIEGLNTGTYFLWLEHYRPVKFVVE